MRFLLSKLGAHVGNWNDRRTQFDSRSEHTKSYTFIDRMCSKLYILGDPHDRTT